MVSFSYEVFELYFQVRPFLSIWTSCKYRETPGRELSSSASNYRNLEKHSAGQSAVSSSKPTDLRQILPWSHPRPQNGAITEEVNLLIFIEKIESYQQSPINPRFDIGNQRSNIGWYWAGTIQNGMVALILI